FIHMRYVLTRVIHKEFKLWHDPGLMFDPGTQLIPDLISVGFNVSQRSLGVLRIKKAQVNTGNSQIVSNAYTGNRNQCPRRPRNSVPLQNGSKILLNNPRKPLLSLTFSTHFYLFTAVCTA